MHNYSLLCINYASFFIKMHFSLAYHPLFYYSKCRQSRAQANVYEPMRAFSGAFSDLRDMPRSETSFRCDSVRKHKRNVVEVRGELGSALPAASVTRGTSAAIHTSVHTCVGQNRKPVPKLDKFYRLRRCLRLSCPTTKSIIPS